MLRSLIITLLVGQDVEKDSTNASLGCYNFTKEALEFGDDLKYALNYVSDHEYFCKDERPFLLKRLREITEDLKLRLKNHEKFFPDFVYQSFEGFSHFLCHNNAQNIIWYYGPESQECLMKMGGYHYIFNGCGNSIISLTLKRVTKIHLCRDMSMVRDCFTRNILSVCPENGSMHQLNTRFFHYIMKPCNDIDLVASIITLSPSIVNSVFIIISSISLYMCFKIIHM